MIVEILFIFVTIAVIAFVYDYYVHHTRFGRLIDEIPGPKRIPIFGNTLQYQVPHEKLWGELRRETEKYYPVMKVWHCMIPFVSIRHPDDLEIILNNTIHIKKGVPYGFLKPWLNTGLLTSTGAKWQSRRKILTPTFHFNILQQFAHTLIEEGERMTKSLKDAGGPVQKDVITFASEHTLNAICETTMGISLHKLGTIQKQYRNEVQQMGICIVYRAMKPWFYPDITFMLSPVGRLQRKLLQNLHQFTENVITERKLYHERTQNKYLQNFSNDNLVETNDEDTFGIKKKRLAMLDLLIAASQENKLCDLDIREEVDTFMFEGHDTTAMGISFILLLLAEHKDIQDRVRDEINTVMQKFGEKLNITTLQNLPYLERCIKESLRLYPSVHFISRITSEDVKLRSGPYTIPAGVHVHLNIYSIHRDANFWPNPDVFDPDRFLPEIIQKRHPYSYLPFSAGPRNCIGQRFAMLEMKALIASIVPNFYLEPIDRLKDMDILINLTLRSRNPMRVRFVPIKAD